MIAAKWYPCDACGAEVGRPCMEDGLSIESLHEARIQKALEDPRDSVRCCDKHQGLECFS